MTHPSLARPPYQIINCLVRQFDRSTERMTDTHRDTVTRCRSLMAVIVIEPAFLLRVFKQKKRKRKSTYSTSEGGGNSVARLSKRKVPISITNRTSENEHQKATLAGETTDAARG